MTKLAIVILNWNGKRFLEQFLPVLEQYLPEYAEIVVADNASSDGSVAFLKEAHPSVRVLEHTENEGFARGYNHAFEHVEAEYYCLLNSDIEVTPHWIEPIIEQMDSDERIAAVQPKLLSYHDRGRFEYAGASGGFVDKYGYPFCRGRVFSNVEDDHGQYDNEMDIFWASGAALFVRSDVYRTMGGLDPDFFAHMEEIDFCWRIKNAGYKIKVNPKSVVYHIGGGTLPKNNSFKTYLNFRNNLFLLLKSSCCKDTSRISPPSIRRCSISTKITKSAKPSATHYPSSPTPTPTPNRWCFSTISSVKRFSTESLSPKASQLWNFSQTFTNICSS